MARYTLKDYRRLGQQYAELCLEYGLTRPGFELVYTEGSKTYGNAFTVYEVARRELWGQKDTTGTVYDEFGSEHYDPLVGHHYLGMTVTEACEALQDRKRMVWDLAKRWNVAKVVTLLDCGHYPTPVKPGSMVDGVAHGEDGSMCYACADDHTRNDLKTKDRVTLYVASGSEVFGRILNLNIITWNGTVLGKIVESSNYCRQATPTGGQYGFYSITVRMEDGGMWHGQWVGPGMYVNLRRFKGGK